MDPRHPGRCAAWIAGAALLLAALPAAAQTPSPLAEWQYSSGILLEKMFEPSLPNWAYNLGLGAEYQPIFPGSQRYRVQPGPEIDIRYKDLLFASTGEGLGVNVLRGPNWRAGFSITYDLGRRAADYNSHLHGLGNIPVAPEAKLFAEYVISKSFPLVIRADVRRALGGSDGWIGDIGAYLPLPGSSERLIMFAGPTLTFADSRWMQSWFGVGLAQSMRSGYRRYDASPGLRSVGFGFSAVWFFHKPWYLAADAAVEQLVGSAAHSPITESATEGALAVTAGYQF